MKFVESLMTRNPCYRTNRSIKVQGIMLHTAGCAQSSAKVFINNWNRPNYQRACVHAFVDASDGTVYQTLPWTHRGWHAFGAGNDTHIGVLLCEPAAIKYHGRNEFEVVDANNATNSVKRTYDATVELCAKLCCDFDLDPMTAICSRQEAHDRGIASEQASPEFVWAGCGSDYTMDGLRADVVALIKELGAPEKAVEEAPVPEPVVEEPKEETIEEIIEQAHAIYAQVDVPNLRIRAGAGTDQATTGQYTGVGKFQLLEIQNGNGSKKGWGRLADGRGWISLDHATIVE